MTGATGPAVEAAVAEAFRANWSQVVATLIGATGDWDLAEECTQDALTAALTAWRRDGVPTRPGAWLMTTARNRATDALRRRAVMARKTREMETMSSPPEWPETPDSGPLNDDRLRLIFTCCHPALPMEGRVALTLRAVVGLSTADIARAFLVSEATMAQRLVRVKRKIRNAAIPYRVPTDDLLPSRSRGVFATMYLLFNEGYSVLDAHDRARRRYREEAIRLARLVAALLPDDAEATGLLALMLLADSRRDARSNEAGELITLADQDRSRWDRAQITEATRLLRTAANTQGAPGEYWMQGAIMACHAEASGPDATDWPQIVGLYDRLLALTPSPVIALNRAVAVAITDGPASALALVDALTETLDGYYLLPATRADLLRRLGRHDEAAEAYRRALTLVSAGPEERFLRRRLADIADT